MLINKQINIPRWYVGSGAGKLYLRARGVGIIGLCVDVMILGLVPCSKMDRMASSDTITPKLQAPFRPIPVWGLKTTFTCITNVYGISTSRCVNKPDKGMTT